nr:hypothetical protein [Tanacetum cinerariifolium]
MDRDGFLRLEGRAVPSYNFIWDPLRRLFNTLITFNISGRCQAHKKVTATNLFYLRIMDDRMAINVPYLLAQLLAEGRLWGVKLVLRNLLMIDMDELVRLRICDRLGDTWAWVAPGPERQQVAAAEDD